MASKTIDHMDFYVAIAPYKTDENGDQVFDSLRVSVGYRKGRGFYVGYHPGWGDERMWGCLFDFSNNPLTAGASIDVEPATKNSAKRIAEMTESLKMAKDIIAALFDDREWEKLKAVLHNVARLGYVEQYKEQAEKYLAERVSKRYEKAIKPTEPVVKQVDVMGLMGALQTKGKAKLSDFATPIESTNESDNQNENIMAQNVKAADLIGKVIIMGTTGAKYVVNSVEGDKLICDFENPTQGMSSKNMPVPFANVQKFIADGKWTVADANEAATTDVTTEADVQEVQDIVPVVTPRKPEPKAEEPKEDKPAAKVEPIGKKSEGRRKKEEKPQPSAIKPQTSDGTLTYETYTSSKGKPCARILGFKETDAAYQNAADIHGSHSWITLKDGRVLYVAFGPKYAAKAKEVCDALNAGKSFEDCKAIMDGRTAGEAKTYSSEDVAAMLRQVLAGGDVPEDIKALMKQAA